MKREEREPLSSRFILPRRERPLLAGKYAPAGGFDYDDVFFQGTVRGPITEWSLLRESVPVRLSIPRN